MGAPLTYTEWSVGVESVAVGAVALLLACERCDGVQRTLLLAAFGNAVAVGLVGNLVVAEGRVRGATPRQLNCTNAYVHTLPMFGAILLSLVAPNMLRGNLAHAVGLICFLGTAYLLTPVKGKTKERKVRHIYGVKRPCGWIVAVLGTAVLVMVLASMGR